MLPSDKYAYLIPHPYTTLVPKINNRSAEQLCRVMLPLPLLFSRALLLARSNSTSHCVMSSVHGPPPPLEMWFLGSSGNFKQLLFLEKKFFFFFIYNFFSPQFFFSSKIFFHSKFFFSPPKKFSHFQFFMHFWMFYAILSAQNNVHPKFIWVKQGTTQCYQAFLVFSKSFNGW